MAVGGAATAAAVDIGQTSPVPDGTAGGHLLGRGEGEGSAVCKGTRGTWHWARWGGREGGRLAHGTHSNCAIIL